MLVITGCTTTEIDPIQEFSLPSFEAFEPSRIPVDLIEEPMTDVDLLHNSIQFEFLLYKWQDYADAQTQYINFIREQYAKN